MVYYSDACLILRRTRCYAKHIMVYAGNLDLNHKIELGAWGTTGPQ